MKKVLLVLSLLGLVFAESNTNTFWGRYNTPSDYPDCCTPKLETKGCCTRCCRGSLVGRPRWSCCRTLRCCRPKNVCCPRYKCCRPNPTCCPAEVPACETNPCVTTPRTTCVEDYSSVPTYANSGTTCVEDYSNSYPTSYGQPTQYKGYASYQNEIDGEELV